MDGIFNSILDSPIGKIEILSNSNTLISIRFIDLSDDITNQHASKITEKCKIQLTEYFNGIRKEFDLPLNPPGTEFQLQVWNLVKEVPFGKTSSYLSIAKQFGDTNKARAIGAANGVNPLLIVIPCHRIIGENKKLIGYSGGIWRKNWLLEHENISSSRQLKLFPEY